jgi:hypothetical protein
MASYQLPGVLCRFLEALEIDGGTLCRVASPVPGPIGCVPGASGKKAKRGAKPLRIYAEHRGVVKNPLSYVGQDVILNASGSPQCTELVKELAAAPRTVPDGTVADGWQRGMGLTESNATNLEIGTPIASGWSDGGFYPNNTTGQHAGIFAGPVTDKTGKVIGFSIVEQYSGLAAIVSRTVYFDPVAAKKKDTYFYRGNGYATITW